MQTKYLNTNNLFIDKLLTQNPNTECQVSYTFGGRQNKKEDEAPVRNWGWSMQILTQHQMANFDL